MKSILIAGGTGFIGFHLSKKCIKIHFQNMIFRKFENLQQSISDDAQTWDEPGKKLKN